SGDDRHRGFRGGVVAAVVWADNAQRAAGTPDVRAVASAGYRGSDQRIQFSGSGLVVERDDRSGVRGLRAVAAVLGDAAYGDRGAENLQSRDGGARTEGRFQPGDRRQPASGGNDDPRRKDSADQFYGFDRSGTARGGSDRGAARAIDSGAGRK